MAHNLNNSIKLVDVLEAMPSAKQYKTFDYLLAIGQDPKTVKSNAGGKYLTAIMYLQPGVTVCPDASRGCLAACLNTAGNGVYAKGKKRARRNRTQLLQNNPVVFLAILVIELTVFVLRCKRQGVKPAVRLNGTSDVAWERLAPWLFGMFPMVQFYDYTKRYERLGRTPRNYWLTFSRSEENDFLAGRALARGIHVSVVIAGKKHQPPAVWRGWRTEDGDKDDLLFARRNPVQVLYPKGRARKDTSGFVILNS